MTPFVLCTLGYVALLRASYWESYVVDSTAACYNLQREKNASNVMFEVLTKMDYAELKCGKNLRDCRDLRSTKGDGK